MFYRVLRIFFCLFSLCYIGAIFLLAGSPVVETLSEFNPYSLLHIPLYGGMTFLLVFSIMPIPRGLKDRSIQPSSNPTRPQSRGPVVLEFRLFLAGGIAWAVGIFDEVHQLYVPGRDSSVGDVALDTIGIAIAMVLCFWLFKSQMLNKPNKANTQWQP